jgi:hypothetical protein
MGFFSSKDNSYLPFAKDSQFLEFSHPSSDEMLMPNFEWLNKCLGKAKSGDAIWNPGNPISLAKKMVENKDWLITISKRIKNVEISILEQIEEEENKEYVDLIYSQLLLGGGLACVEFMSSFRINRLVHPSIHNAMCLSRVESQMENQNVLFGAVKAIEVGYGLLSYQYEPVENFVNNLKKIIG